MSTELVKALREAAEKATPGPWRGVRHIADRPEWDGMHVQCMTQDAEGRPDGRFLFDMDDGFSDGDAAYIALCSPDNILALLDTLLATEQKLVAAREMVEKLRGGIQAYLDGDYEHPRRHRPGQCAHGVYYYEDCSTCDEAHFAALLRLSEQREAEQRGER